MIIKKIGRIVLALVGLFILAAGIFLVWASSPKYSEDAYTKLIESNHPISTDNDSIYSIITYNIGYLSGMTNNRAVPSPKSLFDDNLKIVCSELNEINSDILCFQEIDFNSSRSFYVNQQEEIQELGYNYTFQAVNWDLNYLPFPGYDISLHYGEMYSGQSIISKYPILNPERIVLERVEDIPFYRDPFYLDRLAQVSSTTLEGKKVILINVHLEAYDAKTRSKQTAQIADLYNKYDETFPVLLVGDFNSDINSDNATINTLLEIPGIAYADGNEQNSEKTYPSSRPSKRLDYIFYNKDFIEMKSSKTLTSFGQASDHLPVMMEFRLK